MQISNSAFLITGGASGLGAAVARELVGAGGRVVLADMNRDAGESLAQELGNNAHFQHTDVTNADSTKVAVEFAVSTCGALHGLVNCAGIAWGEKTVGKDGPHKLDSFVRVITINLIGTFNMIRLAADAMVKNAPNGEGERGVIINTASVAAFDGQIGQAAYAASKAGVAGMTLPIARDLARSGIRVNTIAPGIFETPMMHTLPEDVQESLGKGVPFPTRLGRPSEYAALVRHTIENAYLNGETIRLDGALRMAPK